jgi:transcriptional regulator with XRE-family HTH domain
MSALIEEVRQARRFRPKLAKAVRESAGVSQQRLANELGVDRVTVARWELGQRQPHGELLIKYMGLLDGLRAEFAG